MPTFQNHLAPIPRLIPPLPQNQPKSTEITPSPLSNFKPTPPHIRSKSQNTQFISPRRPTSRLLPHQLPNLQNSPKNPPPNLYANHPAKRRHIPLPTLNHQKSTKKIFQGRSHRVESSRGFTPCTPSRLSSRRVCRGVFAPRYDFHRRGLLFVCRSVCCTSVTLHRFMRQPPKSRFTNVNYNLNFGFQNDNQESRRFRPLHTAPNLLIYLTFRGFIFLAIPLVVSWNICTFVVEKGSKKKSPGFSPVTGFRRGCKKPAAKVILMQRKTKHTMKRYLNVLFALFVGMSMGAILGTVVYMLACWFETVGVWMLLCGIFVGVPVAVRMFANEKLI